MRGTAAPPATDRTDLAIDQLPDDRRPIERCGVLEISADEAEGATTR